MDTPELDTSLCGLQAFLDNTDPSDQNESIKEARWLLDTLERYASISTRFQSVLVKARPVIGTSTNSPKYVSAVEHELTEDDLISCRRPTRLRISYHHRL